ncbi:MAG: hypothetical protein LC768_10670 [Acidobacteria bacterium]|nr:hypothetical protein [Acidobacteriota bacterium]MCA1638777.1 hypothetical protein [Acidobacteriota bacterium]
MDKQLDIRREFYECPETPKFEYIDRLYDDSEIEIAVDDLCNKCGKPVDKTVIIIQGVRAKKPDWMTDEHYEEAYAKTEN